MRIFQEELEHKGMNMNKIVSICILILGLAGLYLVRELSPAQRLLYTSLGLIGIIKFSSLFFENVKFKSLFGFMAYLFFWPGVSTKGFIKPERTIPSDTGARFFEHWTSFISGSVLLSTSIYLGKGESTFFNYLSLASFLLIIHVGLVEILRDILKLLKFSPNVMFDRPYMAHSLRDFWSLRWNRAFVEMSKIFFVRPLRNTLPRNVLSLLVFIVSGVLHEIAISFSSGRDFGGPLLYFFIQGLGFVLEKKVKLGKLLTWAIIVLPFPLLFPPSFVNLFLGGLAKFILDYLNNFELSDITSFLLIIGAIAQALVLIASVQVPSRLNWKEDLNHLSTFNKKIFWTYGFYIFSIIIFMSVVSYSLSYSSLSHGGARMWLVFMALFWGARVGVDSFYYSHEDWPKDRGLLMGHICITTLFLFLTLLYLLLLYLSFTI